MLIGNLDISNGHLQQQPCNLSETFLLTRLTFAEKICKSFAHTIMTTANILNITLQLCFFLAPCLVTLNMPGRMNRPSLRLASQLTTVTVQSAFRICPRTAAPVSSTLGHAMAVPFWGCTVTPKRPKLVSPPEPLAAFGSIWTCRKT